jgi:hypothetical protein
VISFSAVCSGASSRLAAARGEYFTSDNPELNQVKTKHSADL